MDTQNIQNTQDDEQSKDVKNCFFYSPIGKTAFYNLVGEKNSTKQLLDEMIAEYEAGRRWGSFCVRISLESVNVHMENGVKYALVWKQIVDKIASVVTKDAITKTINPNVPEGKAHQKAVLNHWIHKHNGKPSNLKSGEILNNITKAYTYFANMPTDGSNSDGAAHRADLWLEDIIFGLEKFRIQLLIIIENFDETAKIFPKEEKFGCFFSKLFTLSPKDRATAPKPTPLGIMVVSEKRGKEIAHSMGGSDFAAAYPPISMQEIEFAKGDSE